MRQKFFVIGTITLMTVVSLFIFEHVTSAQRPDRNAQQGANQRGERPGGDRGNRGMMDNMLNLTINPVSIIENSWVDLSFNVETDDDALVSARPIYKATLEKVEMKMKELRGKYEPKMTEAFASDDRRAAFQKAMAIREEMEQDVGVLLTNSGKEFQAELKEVISKENLTHLNKLTKERQIKAQESRNDRFRGFQQGGQRGGQGGQRGGQGGQRGQRPSQ